VYCQYYRVLPVLPGIAGIADTLPGIAGIADTLPCIAGIALFRKFSKTVG
jgi:hypothetical protein